MGCFLGFDVGTTSIKAAAIDSRGALLASAQIPCALENPKPGYFEIDAPTQWRGGLLKALEALGLEYAAGAEAVCISSVCASFVPMDEAGNPLRKAILYGIDTRASAQFERWNSSFPKESIARIAGNGFTSHSVLPKILWLKENEPEIYDKTARFVESSNYLTSFLTGAWAWDAPSAAGGHMIESRAGEYPSWFLEEVGIDRSKLPPLRSPLEVLGTVTADASAATGIPAGAPVLVGACDVNAEAFACGAFDPGSLLLVYGSTLSALYTVGEFKNLPGFLTGPSILPGTFRLGGATSSGGRYLDWLKRLLGDEAPADIAALEGPTDVLMMPFLDGARLPHQNPSLRVSWEGMSSSTDKRTLWKAAYEAMGCELADLLDRFAQVGPLPSFGYLTGGLASNRQFLQVLADVTGLALLHFKQVNAAYGDALMALSSRRGMDQVRNILSARREEDVETVIPDQELYGRYAEKRRRYKARIAAGLRPPL
ncbi:hypothetical protein LWX53_03935 [bacterium]|nr:hypothetical protein [bacterium]